MLRSFGPVHPLPLSRTMVAGVAVTTNGREHQLEPAVGADAPGWRWNPQRNCYEWWDGTRCTARARWNGSSWSYLYFYAPPVLTPPPTNELAKYLSLLAVILAIPLMYFGIVVSFGAGARTDSDPTILALVLFGTGFGLGILAFVTSGVGRRRRG